MSKQITIEDVVVKEVQIHKDENDEWVMNVLYVTVDSDGNEYPRGWEPYKQKGLTQSIIARLSNVIDSAKTKVRDKEGL